MCVSKPDTYNEQVENKVMEDVNHSVIRNLSNSDALHTEMIRKRNASYKLNNEIDGDKYKCDNGNIFASDKSFKIIDIANVKCSGNAMCADDYEHNAGGSNPCIKCQQQKADNLPKLKVYHKRTEDNIVKNSSVRAALFEWMPQWFKSLIRDPEHLMLGAKKHASE